MGIQIFYLKAGLVFSGKAGSGLVISHLPDGSWSAPSCIATGGLGWGLQIGADITDFVIVLNNEDAVCVFSLGGNVTIGGGISATAGPIGTGGSVYIPSNVWNTFAPFEKQVRLFYSPCNLVY